MPRRPVDVAVDFHRMGGCGKIKNMLFMIKYERGTCTFNPPATARRTVTGSGLRLAAILATRGGQRAAVTAILQCQTGNRPEGYPAARSGPPGKAARVHAIQARASFLCRIGTTVHHWQPARHVILLHVNNSKLFCLILNYKLTINMLKRCK